MTNSINPKIIRQIFILLLILLMGTLIFREMLPYLSGVLGAITVYVLLRKWMAILVKKKGWKPDLSAALLMLLSFVGILVPIAGIILMLGNKIGEAVQNSEKVTKAFKEQVANWEDKIGYDISSQIDVSAVSGWLSDNLQSFAVGTFDMTIAIGFM